MLYIASKRPEECAKCKGPQAWQCSSATTGKHLTYILNNANIDVDHFRFIKKVEVCDRIPLKESRIVVMMRLHYGTVMLIPLRSAAELQKALSITTTLHDKKRKTVLDSPV